ncbi:MAG: DnaD domain protein [Anaerolineae bacterium]
MTKYRKLHTKILESEDVNAMPDDFTRLTWSYLMLVVDSEGRALDNTANLRSKTYPLRVDVTIEMVKSAMDWFANHGMIKRYEVNGKHYLVQCKFREYQGDTSKEAKSIYPDPPSSAAPELVWSEAGVGPELGQSSEQPEAAATTETSTTAEPKAEAELTPAAATLKELINPQLARIGHLVEDVLGLSAKNREMVEGAIREYGPDILEYALFEAFTHNARNWAYIETIMLNRKTGGNPTLRSKARASPRKQVTPDYMRHEFSEDELKTMITTETAR